MQDLQSTKTERSEYSIYRAARFLWVIGTIMSVVVLGMTAIAFLVPLGVWYRVGFAAFALFSFAGLLELRSRKVVAENDGLTIVSDFRRRVIMRSQIESVAWEAGGGVSLKLADGRWHKLPDVGRTNEGLANSIRAWIKRTAKHQ